MESVRQGSLGSATLSQVRGTRGMILANALLTIFDLLIFVRFSRQRKGRPAEADDSAVYQYFQFISKGPK